MLLDIWNGLEVSRVKWCYLSIIWRNFITSRVKRSIGWNSNWSFISFDSILFFNIQFIEMVSFSLISFHSDHFYQLNLSCYVVNSEFLLFFKWCTLAIAITLFCLIIFILSVRTLLLEVNSCLWFYRGVGRDESTMSVPLFLFKLLFNIIRLKWGSSMICASWAKLQQHFLVFLMMYFCKLVDTYKSTTLKKTKMIIVV